MNCQEVMEYMQRQLDGDLDEQEADILMAHTRQCQDCATMLDRLELLSAGLENLPKVTPSYSLVDAIMPRLMELHPEAADPGRPEADEPLPLVRRAERTGRFGRWKNSLSMRTLGGVIAAGVVVGLFLVTYRPGAMDNLSDSAGQKLVAESSMSAGANSAADKSLSEEATDSALQLQKNVEIESAPSSDIALKSDAERSDKSKAESGSDAARNFAPAEETSSQERIGKVQSPNYETTIVNDQLGAAQSDNSRDNESSANTNSYGSDGGNAIADNSIPDNPVTGNSFAGGGETKDSEANEGVGAPIAAENLSVDRMVSPDGIYRAVILDSQLKVYLIADSTLLFESVKRASGFGGLQWSDDSRQLVYETLADDGKLAKFVIDPKNGTEQLQP
ncbi:zf-HC2 domain-containing protein [Paenibacillus oenotherae]|uniref:Anti-sigma-W factor RsiW n=1 Tax=Paenibacillus oenotherae TaxID=1435645 RepID=A0ABS7D1G8_9BACL|nr:zf-HC2 domain-containing protein [Paenibacillus oenotherae]MBW7473748.1 zf-HC2 domain-containing protein [Paenibacillus oenotherae]